MKVNLANIPLHCRLPSTAGFRHRGFLGENLEVSFEEQVVSHSDILENLVKIEFYRDVFSRVF